MINWKGQSVQWPIEKDSQCNDQSKRTVSAMTNWKGQNSNQLFTKHYTTNQGLNKISHRYLQVHEYQCDLSVIFHTFSSKLWSISVWNNLAMGGHGFNWNSKYLTKGFISKANINNINHIPKSQLNWTFNQVNEVYPVLQQQLYILRLVSCKPNVASFSELCILSCPFGFL